MAYAIDTAAAISDLEDAGIESAAARAIVHTVAAADDELATKSDLAALRSDLKADIATVKSELKADMADLRADAAADKADLKTDIADLRSTLTLRIIGAQVATVTLLFAALRFFDS